jgi:serine phosphatase RsbU (regulator of sigma subunit)
MLTRAEAQALLHAHKQALNRKDVTALARFYTDDAVVMSPMFQTVRGADGILSTFKRLFALWPDYKIRVNDGLFIAEENRAAEFGTVEATHDAELFGLAPTGERIEYEFVRLYTFRGDRIAEERRIYDLAGVLERLSRVQIERDLNVAATIQRLLLPRTEHEGSHFEAIGASIPSRTIGGDFFEYVDLPSGASGVALGDASGKGASAALVAAMVQGIFSIEAEVERSPSVTLARVNRALRRRGMEPHFVTLIYGVLTPFGRFRYTNAGQNPPILLSGGRLQPLVAGGPMLGLFDEPEFPEETVTMEPGDRIVLYSDGVTEALNERGDEYGDAGLLESIARHQGISTRALLDAVLDDIRTFCGQAAQRDDITVVVMERR